ncbi:MAG: alpha-L-fucosidase [Flavisolibacter sp.]|nr:alpha-L-fucosidase [Flavisolibacter sp.]
MSTKGFYKVLLMLLFIDAMASNQGIAQQTTEALEDREQFKTEVPEWFKDTKFGIYFHWGVYTVPAFNSEWYSRSMYVPDTGPYKHHKATYGSQEEFGYKDFIPLFKAEYFNADEWVDLFARAGAKFAGPVAEHADGFSMWDSKANPWNAKNMGPKRDIVGELERAVRKRNLKFITTFHHQWQWGWYPTFDTTVDAGNPKYASFYGPVVTDSAWKHRESAEKPDKAFSEKWLAKVKEVINQYEPDILYFDSRLNHLGEAYRKEMLSAFFKNEKDKKQKVILYKSKELPENIGVRTYEKTRMYQIGERPWVTEEPISTFSWSYTEDIQLRTAPDILHVLIDIVSKNGIYLLNICPKADGTIPQGQKAILLAIGAWLHQYGEAIYGTRPWYTYGEGPRKMKDERGETVPRNKYYELTFTADDIRYTTKGNVVYAIILGRPEAGKNILFKAFDKDSLPQKLEIKNVSLLRTKDKVQWQYLKNGLSVRTPARLQESMAVVFKIETIAKNQHQK